MTWTAATETNLDFEATPFDTGWTTDEGAAQLRTITDDGGTQGWQGGSGNAITRLSRTLSIPANAKRVRLTAWLGREFADNDQCTAIVYLYDVGANIIGGITLGSIDNNLLEQQQYVGEAIVPAATDSCKLEVIATRVDGTNNNGACASTAVEWFIDAGLTIYQTPNFLTNGDFEVGDTPPTGWEHVSGPGLKSSTANVFEGTYAGAAESGGTQISQQTIFNVPDGAEQVAFYAIGVVNSLGDEADRIILRLVYKTSAGVQISSEEVWGLCGTLRNTPMTLTGTTIPANTAIIEAQIELLLVSGGGVNALVDAAEVYFTSETAPIDVTPKFYVRRLDGSWLLINPVFAGSGLAGLVPDPETESGRALLDDGTWGTISSDSTKLIDDDGDTRIDADDGTTGDIIFYQDDGTTQILRWIENSQAWETTKPVVLTTVEGDGAAIHQLSGVSVTSQLEVHSEGAGNFGGITIHRHTDSDNLGNHLFFLRSDGTHDAETAVDDNDLLGTISAYGYDGTDYEPAAAIEFAIDGTPASNDMPGEIRFYTNEGSQTLVQQGHIGSDGQWGFEQNELDNVLRLLISNDGESYSGTTRPTALVDISGSATSTVTNAANIPAAVHYRGTVTLPNGSFAFGTGFLFHNEANITLNSGGASSYGGFYGLASQTESTVKQDGGANPTTATSFFWFDVLSQTRFNTEDTSTHTINFGAALVGEVWASSGVTLSDWSDLLARQPSESSGSAGTFTRFNGFSSEDFSRTSGSLIVPTNYTHINLGKSNTYTGKWGIYQDTDEPHRWNAAHFHRFDSYSTAQNITSSHGSAELTGTTARTFTLTTPAAGDVGRRHKFYNSATANLTIATAGAEQIGGAPTQVIGAGNSLEVEWNGTGWLI